MNDLKKRIIKLKSNLCANPNPNPLSYWSLVESVVKEFVINSNYFGKTPTIDDDLETIKIWKEIINKPDSVSISPTKIDKLKKLLFVEPNFSNNEFGEIKMLYKLRNQYAHTLRVDKDNYDVKPLFKLIQKILEKSDEIIRGMKNEY